MLGAQIESSGAEGFIFDEWETPKFAQDHRKLHIWEKEVTGTLAATTGSAAETVDVLFLVSGATNLNNVGNFGKVHPTGRNIR